VVVARIFFVPKPETPTRGYSAEPDQQDERTEEMMAAVGRLLRRG
jgi:hypothetical protein